MSKAKLSVALGLAANLLTAHTSSADTFQDKLDRVPHFDGPYVDESGQYCTFEPRDESGPILAISVPRFDAPGITKGSVAIVITNQIIVSLYRDKPLELVSPEPFKDLPIIEANWKLITQALPELAEFAQAQCGFEPRVYRDPDLPAGRQGLGNKPFEPPQPM